MSVKNNKEVLKAIRKFSGYLISLIVLGVCIFSVFMQTSLVEVEKIQNKTYEYDFIQMKQISLTESMDTLYYYSGLLNTDTKINTPLLFNVISERKNSFISHSSALPERDCRIYRRLASQMNNFLSVKDSIHAISREENLLRTDLVRCISDNRNVSRRLAIGGMSYNQ